MSVPQTRVPVNAARRARQGDARALLSIPEARADIPRLLEGKPAKRASLRDPAQWTYIPGQSGQCKVAEARWGWTFTQTPLAGDFGNRKAIAGAKEIVIARIRRRLDREAAEAARQGLPGRMAQQHAGRRHASISGAVGAILDRCYRRATSSWAGGETTNSVTLSEHFHASGDTSRAWSRNGKWSGQDLTRRVQVSPRWDRDVQARGLAEIDGLLTTHAEPVPAPEGFEAFRAAWVRQSRGLDLRVESGAIARHVASGTTYHGATREAAIGGLVRKLRAQAVPAEVRAVRTRTAQARRADRQARQLGRLVERLIAWDLAEVQHVVVSRADSIKAGNCVPGTDAWIDRFFPDRDSDSATIGEIAARVGRIDPASLRGDDLTLARQLGAACLVAIRRDRRARRLVLA